ncbi:MAG: YfhO family protein [Ruminococcus sp.]|nr:YfhO family protein [Ruminococcus sp.]
MAESAKQSAAGKTEKKPAEIGLKKDFRALAYYWLKNNYIYLLAFFIPALLTYISYIIFGIYPFGPESVLALDLNGQYVYYFEEIRDTFWGDGSPFYSWSRNLSGEFMGVIGYYLASPFTLIVILLPRKMLLGSLLIMQLCKLGAAGTTFCYFLQKSKKIKPLHALMFSLLYAMMAYAVIQLIDPMWLDGLVFLPMIILGLEYCIDDGRKINYIIPLAMMCIANFYIGFMVCIFTGLYFFYYMLAGSDTLKRKGLKKKDWMEYAKAVGRVALSTGIGVMIAAIMLLPVYNALKLGKFDFTEPNYAFTDAAGNLRTQFEILEFFAQLFVNQYNEVDVKGFPEIYCGVLTTLLLPMFFMNGEIPFRKKVGLTSLLLIMIVSMDITPIDMLWHGGQVPNWLPYRYSFILSFILLNMAAMTFQNIKGIKPSAIYTSFFICFMFLMFAQYEIKDLSGLAEAEGRGQAFYYLDVNSYVWPSVALIAIYGLLMFFFTKKNKSKALPIIMVCVMCVELTMNCVHSMKDIDEDVAYSERKTYHKYIATNRELVDQLYEYDDSFYRADKTYHRTVNDSLALGLRGITHSSSVMNTRVIKFIEAMGYTCRSYYTKYKGSTPISDSLLGIKYVIDMEDGTPDVSPFYEKRFTANIHNQQEKEKEVAVYENTNALAIGYMAEDDILRISKLGNDNPFNSQNVFLSSLTGQTEIDSKGAITYVQPYFSRIELAAEPILNNVTPRPYGTQTCYDESGTGDHTIDLRIKATTSEPIYFYFKTENEKKVNLWLGTDWFEDGQFVDCGAKLGTYYEGDEYCIKTLGSFEPGQELTLRLTVANGYTIVKDFFFYHFNYELFDQDIALLQDQQWELTEADTTYLEGKITAKENQVMVTSIPYEPGWIVKVDGKRIDDETLQKNMIVNAFIGIPMEAGEHTVTMRFVPAGFTTGLALFCMGVACVVMFFFYDRKHNKMLLALVRERKEKRDAFLEVRANAKKK